MSARKMANMLMSEEAAARFDEATQVGLAKAGDEYLLESLAHADDAVKREVGNLIGAMVLKIVRREGSTYALSAAKTMAESMIKAELEERRDAMAADVKRAVEERWGPEVERAARDLLERALQDVRRRMLGG